MNPKKPKYISSGYEQIRHRKLFDLTNIEPQKFTIKGKGHFYSINSIVGLKEISSIEKFNEVNRKSRAFYYPPHEPAYFISDGKKYYVIPEPVYHESVI